MSNVITQEMSIFWNQIFVLNIGYTYFNIFTYIIFFNIKWNVQNKYNFGLSKLKLTDKIYIILYNK